MTSLIEFFNTVTGLPIDFDNPVFKALAVIFGFLICYDIIHIVFGSMFGFTYFKR